MGGKGDISIKKQKRKHFRNQHKIESISWLIDYYKQRNNDNGMVKFLDKAVKKNDIVSMAKLGDYYREKKDEENMIKYYDMAIENGRYDVAIYVVGYYEELSDSDEKKLIKYMDVIEKYCNIFVDNFNDDYSDDIIKNGSHILQKISGCYMNILNGEFNYDFFKKICYFSIEKGDEERVMYYLGDFYYNEYEKNDEKMVKYLLMASDKNHMDAMVLLGHYYGNKKDNKKMEEYYFRAINIDKNHIYYSELMYQCAEEILYNYLYNNKDIDGIKKLAFIMIVKHHDFSNYYNIYDCYDDFELSNECDEEKIDNELIEYIKDNDEFFLETLEICANKDFVTAMHELGNYYKKNHNYNEMKKYFNIAIYDFLLTITLIITFT